MSENITNENNTKSSQDLETVNQCIQDIIQKRKSLAERIIPVYRHIVELENKISAVEKHRSQLISTINDGEIDLIREKTNIQILIEKLRKNSNELNKIIERLSRDTLNIGVIGRMGQGKSTLLQSLTGLGDEIIPARQGKACTAVRSKISHHDGEIEITIKKHSKNTFLNEVIQEYWHELGFNSLRTLNSLEDFSSQPLPPPPPPENTTYTEMYNRLKFDYYDNYHNYYSELEDNDPQEVRIKTEDIPLYVTQQRNEQGEIIDYRHLIVREASIKCCFPQVQVKKLALLDIPGIGDTRAADEKLILQTLEEETDIVLFVRKPDVDRYQWQKEDFKLHELANKAFKNLEDRAFYILNHRSYGESDNMQGCKEMQVDTKSIKAIDKPFIIDCSNNDAANKVLNSILKYLDEEIIRLEEAYALSSQKSLLDTQTLINDELEKVQNVFISYAEESRQFETKFKHFINNLTKGLNDLLEELWKDFDKEDADFDTEIDEALKKCDNNKEIPSQEKIKILTNSPEYKNRYSAVYDICVVQLRSNLSKNFLTLEQGLQKASDKLKNQIADVLTNEGCLDEFAKNLQVEKVELLEIIEDALKKQNNKLELGFNILLRFEMSYGALIMKSIRQELGKTLGGVRADSEPRSISKQFVENSYDAVNKAVILGTNLPKMAVDPANAVAKGLTTILDAASEDKEITDAASIEKKLKNLHSDAVENCKVVLKSWSKEPNKLRYYMAEEFIDYVLYNEDIKEEWRHFLNDEKIRSKVWSEFKQIENQKKAKLNWIHSIQQVQKLNKPDLLKFL